MNIDIRRLSMFLAWVMPYYWEKLNKFHFKKVCINDNILTKELLQDIEQNSVNDEDFFFIALNEIKLNLQISLFLEKIKPYLENLSKSLPDEFLNIKSPSTLLVDSNIKPIIFTEWKTDVSILKLAYLKYKGVTSFTKDNFEEVFEKESDIKIESCDLNNWEKSQTYADAKTLWNVIHYWKWEWKVIWIFDRDDGWNKWFHNINTKEWFEEITDEDKEIIKIKYKNWKNYALWILYPIPPNREWYKILDNQKDNWAIELEYFFDDDDIIKMWFKNSIKGGVYNWFTYSKLDISGKNNFVKKVTEKHEVINFSNFNILFDKVLDLLNK